MKKQPESEIIETVAAEVFSGADYRRKGPQPTGGILHWEVISHKGDSVTIATAIGTDSKTITAAEFKEQFERIA